MKKIMFLFALLTVILSANAQEKATYDQPMGYADTWFTYNMPTSSYAMTATDSTWYFTTWKLSDAGIKYDIKLTLDSVGGTKQITPVLLKAKKQLSDSWTTITTVNWTNGHDTTILFNQTSTSQYYRYWQVYLKSNRKGFIVKIPELSEIFWK
jgi:hypothetical protein